MNQAEKIRRLTTDMLLNNDELLEDIIVNNKEIKGIRYSVLKNELLNFSKYDFTEGGVTGALYTLTDKMDSIFKVKVKNGVYFYYSSEKNQEEFKSSVIITESKEYENLILKADDLFGDVSSILTKASNEFYKNANDIDVKYLRKILGISSDFKDVLKEYKLEKNFERIRENLTDDDLPF